jgi:histidinol-phosphate/aromatic aminotransferase/cobyric acid decarboxylase-like protein
MSAKSQRQSPHVELRTGTPYANLIAKQRLFAAALGKYFGVCPDDCLPMTGATGAIEAARNHIFRTTLKACPTVLTVCPGYWRARESFEGFGFRIINLHTEPLGFVIAEAALVAKAAEVNPDLLYLSLPNNPTGAIFDPEVVIAGTSEKTAVIIDLTLPSRAIDARALTLELYRKFSERRNLFLVGSTSKSHGTAEYRIGWAVCANSEDADQLKKENRNVIASASITKAIRRLGRDSTAIELIENSFALLREGEKWGGFELVTPERKTETGYVLIRVRAGEELRSRFDSRRIRVMWGSEFGLTDEYIRLETLEPRNIRIFVEAINGSPYGKPVRLASRVGRG